MLVTPLLKRLIFTSQIVNQTMMTDKLTRLRYLMNQKGLSAYLIPSEDAHQSEYTSSCDARREFVSGFSGSAGYVIVTTEKAALWTDGRYYIQADKQLSPRQDWILMKGGLEETPTKEKWLKTEIKAGDRIGVDPKLISFQDAKSFGKNLEDNNLKLSFEQDNLIDMIWEGKPPRPHNPILELPIEYSGVASQDKISKLQKYLSENEYSSMIVTALDEIAWLLNLRGSDIPYNPLFYSFAIVTSDKVILYADESKLPQDFSLFSSRDIKVKPYESIYEDVKTIPGSKILASPSCNAAIAHIIGVDRIVIDISPIEIEKAIKNSVEIEGFKKSHLKDGVAVCRYICWLQEQLSSEKSDNIIDEVDGSEKLTEFRMMESTCKGPSFDTISSVGANAAIIHYKPEKSSAAIINTKEIYLLDSGGQYLDGTTDVTRTMHFGSPSEEERENFTRVLKGNLALNMIKFPKKTTGLMLDSLARMYLWKVGLDYRHGTGHGVGHYLNVHEGPHGISMRSSSNEHSLKSGMTVTDEPGFYKEKHYGIRIENVLLVRDAKLENNFGNVGFLEFENITMVPIQKKLIKMEMLTIEEINFLNDYHQECWDKLSPLLKDDQKTLDWLRDATLPL